MTLGCGPGGLRSGQRRPFPVPDCSPAAVVRAGTRQGRVHRGRVQSRHVGRTQPGCTGCGGAGVPPPDSGSPGAPGNAGTALEGTPGPPYSSAARVHAGSHRGPAGPAPAPWPGVWRPVTCEKSCAGCSCPDERCWLRMSGSEFEFDPEGDSRQRGLGRVLGLRTEAASGGDVPEGAGRAPSLPDG